MRRYSFRQAAMINSERVRINALDAKGSVARLTEPLVSNVRET